jgi:hypothetical protein
MVDHMTLRPEPVAMPWLIAIPALLVLLAAAPSAESATLPAGAVKPALAFPHFPDRLHAFVWRNWGLVPAGRLAAVLDTSADNVRALAASMGLPAEEADANGLDDEWRRRGYITLIRRNWHLLPYDQLLALLDVPEARLAYLLREDDFLFVKLGNLKPACPPLHYAPPDARAAARAAEIKRLVAGRFGPELARSAEPRFAFVKDLSEVGENAPDAPPRPPPNGSPQQLRFVYSYFAVYGDPLSDPSLDPYPDGLLRRLAAAGVNGVWLHVLLRDLAPGGDDFPEFGRGHEKRLAALRALVDRAGRYGIGVYLYLNEPRALPAAFFDRAPGRPDMAGVREGDYAAMCTSDPRVRRWLSDAVAYVFRNVPHLAGAFTITASENLTHCASHGHADSCPRCKVRPVWQIVAEVNAAIEAGVHAASPDAKVLAWDWGWPDDWAQPVIDALPKSCWLMSVSEWSLPIERGGVRTTVGEYSISAVGPGPRAKRHWDLARRAGLKIAAKVQLNNTWELSAVPYLPVMDLVAEHCRNLAAARVDGLMLSWTLGGHPSSPNLELARRIADAGAGAGAADVGPVLDALAADGYGPDGAPQARRAWTHFSDAFRQYPFAAGSVYTSPLQYGPANLLYAAPTGYKATMVGFPYDDVNAWRGPYPAEVFAEQFRKVADGWSQGLAELARAADAAPPDKQRAAQRELGVARAAGLHFRSAANQVRFVLARDALRSAPAGMTPAERRRRAEEVRAILQDETKAAAELFALARHDARLGFEASNHYYYVPQDLMEKVVNCQDLLDRLGDDGTWRD